MTPCTPGLDPERRTFRIERLTYEGTAWARAVVRSVRPRERVVIPFEDDALAALPSSLLDNPEADR